MPDVRTVVVGTRFRGFEGVAALAKLNKGDPIELRAEPDNQYDANAVACYSGGVHVGYLPRTHNVPVAAALGRGWIVGAVVALEAIVEAPKPPPPGLARKPGEVVAVPKIVITYAT